MSLIDCPSCTNKVSSTAVFCPKCGHQFKAASANIGLNTADYVGIFVCFGAIVGFLFGAVNGPSGTGMIVASLCAFVFGLIVCAVGRIKAGR
jgi:hypothetical protein